MRNVNAQFFADVTLYATEKGGRESAIVADWFGCPVKVHEQDFSAWDFRILTQGEAISPGETKRFGVVFLMPEAGALFRRLPKFYLWEGKIIGEVKPEE